MYARVACPVALYAGLAVISGAVSALAAPLQVLAAGFVGFALLLASQVGRRRARRPGGKRRRRKSC